MATRLYGVATTAAAVSPTPEAGWQSTTGFVRRKLSRVKAAGTETRSAVAVASGAGSETLGFQLISEPLAAQEITGTVTIMTRGREIATQDNLGARVRCVRVVSGDGSTVRGTLLAHGSHSVTTELGTTVAGYQAASAAALSPVTAEDGDRLVVELGYGMTTTGTTPQYDMVIGGNGTDHANAATDATGTVPWVELSQDLTWLVSFPWDSSTEGDRLTKQIISAPSEGNVSQLLSVDTTAKRAIFDAPSGSEPALDSGQRDVYVVGDSVNLGIRHARGTWWGGPTMGDSDVGTMSPQHGFALRHLVSGGRRRIIAIWQNIIFTVYWSVLVGVWAGDTAVPGANFINRQIGFQNSALGSGNQTVTASARSGNVVTLSIANADQHFVPHSWVKVDLATASFDGWFLITGVTSTDITYNQTGTNESGGTGTAVNILPYDVDVRLPGGSICEVRSKAKAATAWPDWVTYDADAGVDLTGSAGTFVSMPDAAALDLNGTITLVTDITATDWVPGLHQSLLSKFTTSNPSGQRSFRSRLLNNGCIDFGWSTAGTSGLSIANTTPLGITDGTRKAIAAEFIPNDGAGNRKLRVYTAPTHKGPWTLHQETVVAGATTIFQGTAPLELGSVNNGALEPFQGRFHYAAVINGTLAAGTPVAEFMPMNHPDASATINDPTSGFTWTMNGSAALDNTGIPNATPEAFAVDIDMAGAWSVRQGDPTPTDDNGEVGYIVAHLGTDDRSQVSMGPYVASSSLADFPADTEEIAGTAAQIAAASTQSAAGEETITGTAAQTDAAATQSATGGLTITGTAAQTTGAATQSATGDQTITGTAAQTTGAATQAANGTHSVGVSGTAAQTTGSASQSATGTEAIIGTGAQATPPASQSATGTEAISGTGAQDAPAASQSAAGGETISGTAAQTGPKAQQSATGPGGGIAGTAEQTTGEASQSATGAETFSGTGAQTGSKATQSASGGESIGGTAAQTAPKASQSATGAETITGTAAQAAPAAEQAAVHSVVTAGDGADITVTDLANTATFTDVANTAILADGSGMVLVTDSSGLVVAHDLSGTAVVADVADMVLVGTDSGSVTSQESDGRVTVQESQ